MPILDPQSLTRHVDRLYRAAWALCGRREDAEDLVQETFARVLARPRQLSGDGELAYLMQVLRNTFLTSRRTAARRPQTGAPLEEGLAADERASASPEHALRAKELYDAIGGLSEDFRLALVAIDILGLSYREAGEALGVREATITTRLFRARRQVVKALEGELEPAQAPPEADRLRRPSVSATEQPRADSAGADTAGVSAAVPPTREGTRPRERLAEQGNL